MSSTTEPSYPHPALWVPTSYFAMGAAYTMVTTSANIMFANVGLPNDKAALYSSLTGFAFSFKPLWAPLLELYKTKKFFVVLMQLVLAACFAGIALALKLPAFVIPVVILLMIAAIAGATQDIGSDGVYVTTLDPKRQAAFAGVQSMCWSIGPVLAASILVGFVGLVAGEAVGQPKPEVAEYTNAWLYAFLGLGALIGAISLWHTRFLPPGDKAKDAPTSFVDAMSTFGKVFTTFFAKKDVLLLLGFAFFYRFGLGLLDKVGPLFLIDARENGGLGLNNTTLGVLNGIATVGFIAASLAGGLYVSRRGLKKSLLPLCLALNVPNITFLYLGLAQPESVWIIGTIFIIEKLGWGFGAVGHMIYMMQQIAPGPYRTAHYAFATGIGLSLCMTITGMVSGYIQTAVGYHWFFIIVLIAAIPSLIFTVLAPYHHRADYENEDKKPAKA